MKVFQPKAEVRLIKAAKREELAEGINANGARYGNLTAIDLTPYLADSGGLSVSKQLGAIMGGFSLSFPDRMHTLGESVSALVEPMDLIEIRLAHDPADPAYAKAGTTSRLPILMRGFVTSVRRVESMSGGNPSRTVVIQGHDFGKVLEILRIYYLQNSVVGDIVLSELKFFQKYAGVGADKIMPAATFVALVMDKIVTPYLGYLTQLADGSLVGAKVVNQIGYEVSIPGVVSPRSVSYFNDGSVAQFLGQFLDVGTFNEMFLDEREDGVVLVVRPNHFLDVAGNPINPVTNDPLRKSNTAEIQAQLDAAKKAYDAAAATAKLLIKQQQDDQQIRANYQAAGDATSAEEWRQKGLALVEPVKEQIAIMDAKQAEMDQLQAKLANASKPAEAVIIPAEDVESSDLVRSDQGVANYFWVTNASWVVNENQSVREMSQKGNASDYAPFTYQNCAVRRYGFRKMEVESTMGPDLQSNTDAMGVATANVEMDKLLGWLVDRRVKLSAMNRDNVVFESGSMTLRGNEKIKLGTYIVIRRGGLDALYYVTGVSHSFQPFGAFKTSVTVERGTGFITRAQKAASPYLAELTVGGIK